jgi:hypothetical protein
MAGSAARERRRPGDRYWLVERVGISAGLGQVHLLPPPARLESLARAGVDREAQFDRYSDAFERVAIVTRNTFECAISIVQFVASADNADGQHG